MRKRGRPPARGIRWWAWIVLLAIGLAMVAAGFGWSLVILVAMAWLTVVLYRKATPAAAAPAEPQARELLAQPRRSVDAALGKASTYLLCELWVQTGQELRRTYLPSTVCSYAELRQAVLDELTSREPDAVRRWLEDEPDRRNLLSYLPDHQR